MRQIGRIRGTWGHGHKIGASRPRGESLSPSQHHPGREAEKANGEDDRAQRQPVSFDWRSEVSPEWSLEEKYHDGTRTHARGEALHPNPDEKRGCDDAHQSLSQTILNHII